MHNISFIFLLIISSHSNDTLLSLYIQKSLGPEIKKPSMPSITEDEPLEPAVNYRY